MNFNRNLQAGFTSSHRVVGELAALSVFVFGVAYTIVTALGFLSLASPQDPIGYPYVTLMELLILPLAALYLVTMVAIHAYARPAAKIYSLTALVFMTVLAAITTSVHFVILTVGPQLEATGLPWVPLVISFTWPSVLYALDILAWDWFFALSLLFASFVFTGGRLELAVRTLLLVSGVLSLVGLVGVPLADMQVRNIGIVGYAVVSPIAFLLIGILFRRTQTTPDTTEQKQETHPSA
ncbi:hypothetical protein SAMN04487950_2937 [Halogranum rubrum]|uniref:Uncharacterized protein n=1 Tax=Halogranum rubrum TaxID=553466 RepID=A0A1I4FZ34_9EURY|nr:hypothetical protein [Halogranum rubrum]SFL23085.1 hypothetical protein SAMN04487950_2937 [Halogranum rubrum]